MILFMKPLYFVTHYLFRGYFRFLHKHKIFGYENIPAGGAIIAPNHVSFYDPPIISASCKEEAYFLARGSLFNNRFFSWLIRNLNAYPVSGTSQDRASLKLVCDFLEQKKKVVVFPEGVRSYNGKLAPIKSGIGMLAMRSKCPIIPTYIHGTYEVWDRSRKYPKLWGQTAVYYGKPIYWDDFAHLEKKEALEQITQAVADGIEELRIRAEKTPPNGGI